MFLKPISIDEIGNILIIIPEFNNNIYINEFSSLNANKKNYEKIVSNRTNDSIEGILNNEIINRIRIHNDELIRPLIIDK